MRTATSRRRSSVEPLLALLRQQAVDQQPDPDAVVALLRAAQGGDAESFGKLYDLYVHLAHHYAYYYSGSREVAETVAAETLQNARVSILHAGERGESFAAWLVSIAQTRVRTYTGTATPYRSIANLGTAEISRWLSAVQRLHLPQREAILMLCILRLGVPDIAFITGRDARQVTTLLLTSLVTLDKIFNP